MILLKDGIWSISRTHLKILKTLEDISKNKEEIDMDYLKNKTNVQNFNKYLMDLSRLKYTSCRGRNCKLTISGMDCLAINKLRERGLEKMGDNIGIGKESDIYFGVYKGQEVVLKFHRVGRTSFKNGKNKRDYLKNLDSWFKMNKVSCYTEMTFMNMFSDMDIPKIVDYDRHVLVMELLDYEVLYMTKSISEPVVVFNKMINFVKALWERGYVHGDFNEFNVMVKGSEIKVIDFPQCIKNTHREALEYLMRDFKCIETYFYKKYQLVSDENIFEEFLNEFKQNEEQTGYLQEQEVFIE